MVRGEDRLPAFVLNHKSQKASQFGSLFGITFRIRVIRKFMKFSSDPGHLAFISGSEFTTFLIETSHKLPNTLSISGLFLVLDQRS
jgi:hypothetical protein